MMINFPHDLFNERKSCILNPERFQGAIIYFLHTDKNKVNELSHRVLLFFYVPM